MKQLYILLTIIFLTLFTACSSGGSSSSITTDITQQSSTTFKAYYAPSQNNIAINASLVLKFSQDLKDSTIISQNIYIKDSNNNIIDSSILIEGADIKITPAKNLTTDATYSLIVTTDVKNKDGIALSENYEWEFTAKEIDSLAPVIKSLLPASGSSTADVATNIILEFDELLDSTTIQADTLELVDSSNNAVSGTFGFSNQWLWFFPSSNLNSDETYTIKFLKSVNDLSGNAYNDATSFTFSTSATILNSDGFDKVTTDLDLASTTYSMLVKDDTTIFVGLENKLSKISTTRNNSVPEFTLITTQTSNDFGLIYDIKTLKTPESCSAYNNLVLATSKGLSILNSNDLAIESFTAIESSSFGLDVVCNTSDNHVYAYVASSSSGVNIFDITDPANVSSVKSFDTDGVVFDIISKYSKIYTASYSNGVNVYDNAGASLQHFSTDSTSRALEIDGSELIVSNGTTGIKKLTISDQGVLSELSQTPSLTTTINSYTTADNIFAITTTKGISVISKTDSSKIAYQIPTTSRFINTGADSEFLYTLSLNGVVSAYNLTSTQDSGQAIDGYLAGATVFKDCNANKLLDVNDSSTIADAQGNYSLGSTPYKCKDAKLIAQGGIDISTGIAFKGILIAPSGSKNITPLTTLIDADPSLEASLLSELGVSSIDEDFVGIKNSQAMKLSLSITNVLTLMSDTTNTSFDPTVISETISQIATELKADPTKMTDAATMSTTLAQVASDSLDNIAANNPNMSFSVSNVTAFKQSVQDMIVAINNNVSTDGVVDSTNITTQIDNSTTAISTNIQLFHTPTTQESSYEAHENTPIVNVLNANDEDNNTLLFHLTQSPTHGTLSLDINGSFTYTPDTNFYGTDSFKYDVNNTQLSSSIATVFIKILSVNYPPISVDDNISSIAEDTNITVDVLANDSDSDGSLLPSSLRISSYPRHGSTTINTSTGEIFYKPYLNYNGIDSFKYKVKDNEGSYSNEATVSLTIDAVNDSPIAKNDSITLNENTNITINVLLNDSEPDSANGDSIKPSTLAINTQATHGALSVDATTGIVTYTPDADYFGVDSFTYSVQDQNSLTSNVASVSLTIIEYNEPPSLNVDTNLTIDEDTNATISYIASDVDGTISSITVSASNGSATVDDATHITYTPLPNYNGSAIVTIRTTDNDGDTTTKTSTITINSLNDAPTITMEHNKTVGEDQNVTITFIAQDVDSTISISALATNGSVVINSSTITYIPNTNYNGSDTITIRATDNDGAYTEDSCDVTITPQSDITLNLTNINLSINNIKSIYAIETNATDILLENNISSGDSTVISDVYYTHNYSLKFVLDDNSSWWYNFNDTNIYANNLNDGNFTTIIGNNNNNINLDLDPSKWIDNEITLNLVAHGGVIQTTSNNGASKNSTISSNDKNITLEAWINYNGLSDESRQIIFQNGHTTGYALSLEDDGGVYKVAVMVLGSGEVVSDFSISPKQWYHIAAVKSQNEDWKIYVDGNLTTLSNPSLTPSTPNGDNFSIAYDSFKDYSFRGLIDEVRLWGIARTQADIIKTKNTQLKPNENGLTAYYNFDEKIGDNIYDITPNDNLITKDINTSRVNFLGDSLNFDGSNDKITLNGNLDNSSITICGWINSTATDGSRRPIFSTGTNRDTFIYVDATDNTLHFENISGDSTVVSPINSIHKDEWTHFSVIMDDDTNTSKMYINSHLVATDNYTNKVTSSGNSAIGFNGADGGTFFKGAIAELSLWHKALSEEEVKLTMVSSLGGDETALGAYWVLNNSAQTSAVDYSSNNQDGTFVGTFWTNTAPNIYGTILYTSSLISSFEKLNAQNNTTTPLYSYANSSYIQDFNSTNGNFFYVANGSEIFDISDTQNSIDLNISVVSYNSNLSLSHNDDLNITQNYTLTANLIVHGNVNISAGNLDLNGYKLIVDGHLNITAGDILMNNPNDYLHIKGNYTESSWVETYNEGIIQLDGDFTKVDADDFKPGINHKFIFSGTTTQTINFNSTTSTRDYFSNLEIKNLSSGGVVFNDPVIIINEIIYDDNVKVTNKNNVRFGGTITLNQDRVLNNDFLITAGNITLNGHKLTINGDLNITGGDISMNNPNDYLHIKGNYTESSWVSAYNQGTIEIEGNFTKDSTTDFKPGIYHKFIFSGEETQEINFVGSGNYDYFSNMIINNHSNGGVNFNDPILITNSLTINSCIEHNLTNVTNNGTLATNSGMCTPLTATIDLSNVDISENIISIGLTKRDEYSSITDISSLNDGANSVFVGVYADNNYSVEFVKNEAGSEQVYYYNFCDNTLNMDLNNSSCYIRDITTANSTISIDMQNITFNNTLNENLILYLPFEDSSEDITAHGFDGKIIGAPQYVDGVIGKAIYLDGSVGEDDVVRLSALPAIWDKNEISVCYWVDGKKYGTFESPFTLSEGQNNVYLYFHNYYSELQWKNSNPAGINHKSNNFYTSSSLNHVCLTIDKDGLNKFYVDGKLDKEASDSNFANVKYLNNYIGHLNISSSAFKGMIDEVKIYNRALSSTEVLNLKNLTTILQPPLSTSTAIITLNNLSLADTKLNAIILSPISGDKNFIDVLSVDGENIYDLEVADIGEAFNLKVRVEQNDNNQTYYYNNCINKFVMDKNSSSCYKYELNQTANIVIDASPSNFINTLNENLVVYLAFEDDTTDITGHGINGDIIGDPVFVDGVVGKAIYFDRSSGADDVVKLAAIPAVWDENEMSVCYWVDGKMDGTFESPFSLINSSGDENLYFWNYYATLKWDNNNGTGSTTNASINFYKRDVVNHICLTIDKDGVNKFYIDGILTTQVNGKNFANVIYDDNNIGHLNSSNGAFRGMIDEVKIYNRVLNDVEVLNLKNTLNVPDVNLSVNIQNLNISTHKIDKLKLILNDNVSYNIDLNISNLTDGNNSLISSYIPSNQIYSLNVELDNYGISEEWWYNFDDGKFYHDNNGSSEFYSNISSDITLNMDSNSWVTNGKTHLIHKGAVDFNKTKKSIITIPQSSSLQPTTQVTLESWIYAKSFTDWDRLITNSWDTWSYESGYAFRYHDGKVRFFLNTVDMGGNDWNDNPGASIELNKWVHIAGTYDGATIKFYLDGKLVASEEKTGAIEWSPTPTALYLGGGKDDNEHYYFDGKLDEVRIWDRALTQDEIKANISKQIDANETNLLAYYSFDEYSGRITYDISDNGHNGTYGGLHLATRDHNSSEIPTSFTSRLILDTNESVSATFLSDTKGPYSVVTAPTYGTLELNSTNGDFTFKAGEQNTTFTIQDDTSNKNTTISVQVNQIWDKNLQISDYEDNKVLTSFNHTLIIKKDASLWAWGYNNIGQLGDGTTTQKVTPIRIGRDNNWKSLATTSYPNYNDTHSGGIKTDGTLWMWGEGDSGRLGTENTTDLSVPTQIGSDTNWAMLSIGLADTYALKTDGTLWTWGKYTSNRLGQGTSSNILTPTQLGTDSDWVYVSAGARFGLAIKDDGTLWTWGQGTHGQLGLNYKIDMDTPQMVGFEHNWKIVNGGFYHSLGIKQDGTLWSWGYATEYALGLGNTTNYTTPQQVGVDSDWEKIEAGYNSSFAIKEDSLLYVWGSGYKGRLGSGNETDLRVPTKLNNEKYFSIHNSDRHTVFVKDNGRVYTSGVNSYGQLGKAYPNNSYIPILIDLSTQSSLTKSDITLHLNNINTDEHNITSAILLGIDANDEYSDIYFANISNANQDIILDINATHENFILILEVDNTNYWWYNPSTNSFVSDTQNLENFMFKPLDSSNEITLDLSQSWNTQSLDSLIAYYPLNNNIDDYSTARNTPSLHTSQESYSEGAIGKALNFDGTNTYLQTPISINQTDGADIDYTISLWIKPFENGQQRIFSTDTHSWDWQFYIKSGGWYYANGSGGYDTGINVNYGMWQHITISYDTTNNEQKIYLDSELISTDTISYNSSSNLLYFGVNAYDGSSYIYKGAMGEIRIYEKLLTQSEIKQLMNEDGLNIKLNLSNTDLNDKNITAVSLVGQDINTTQIFKFDTSTIQNGDNNLTMDIPAFTNGHNYSLRFDVNNSNTIDNWWYNFVANDFNKTIIGTIDNFTNEVNTTNREFNLDLSVNWNE